MNQFIKPSTHWLSSIGSRLILAALVSVFATTAFAADCKVNDSDTSVEFVGDCVNGLVQGKRQKKSKRYVPAVTQPANASVVSNNQQAVAAPIADTPTTPPQKVITASQQSESGGRLAAAGGDAAVSIGFKDNSDGTVTDPKTGLTWMRCMLDQQWTGTSCQGRPKIRNWWESLIAVKSLSFAGYKDWRLPSLQDLNGIRTCSLLLSNSSTASTASGEFRYHPWCAARTTPIDESIFVGLAQSQENEYVWSSTQHSKALDNVYSFCFSQRCLSAYGGLLDSAFKQGSSSKFPKYILAVRGGKPEADYESSLSDAKKFFSALADNEARERKESKLREAQEREENRRREAYARTPAGRAEAQHRQQQQQGRQMCEAQKQTCFASCPQWRDGANNYAAFSCEKDCQKISCN